MPDDFAPRRVPADTDVSYTTAAGEQRTLRSKGSGDSHTITPKDAEDAAILTGFGYPVARRAAKPRKTETRADNRARRGTTRPTTTPTPPSAPAPSEPATPAGGEG